MGLKELARRLPPPLERAVRYAYGAIPMEIRLGRRYRRMRAFLRESQRWNREQLLDYQTKQLADLLQYAYDNVEYYREVFDSRKIKPRDIRTVQDLSQLPFLTKDLIKEHLQSLVSKEFPLETLIRQTTGGSTGQALGFYEPQYAEGIENAFMFEQWLRVGYQLGDGLASLRGNIVLREDNHALWQADPIRKVVLFSAYHIDQETTPRYVAEMQRRRIQFLHGHPSSIATLAGLLVRQNLHYPLKCVLGGSEAVYEFQEELVNKAFGCRIFSWYGQSEKVVLAGECEQSKYYHCFPEYGVTEIVDSCGRQIWEPGKPGEIVGTGFINRAMPFIRYRAGDIASFVETTCPCGRNYPLLSRVEGRTDEYVYTSDGRALSLTGLIFGQHFDAFSRLRKMQLHQTRRGLVEVRIVPYPDFSHDDENEIRQLMKKCAGKGLEVAFSYPDEIAATTRGKHRFLVQDLPSHLTLS